MEYVYLFMAILTLSAGQIVQKKAADQLTELSAWKNKYLLMIAPLMLLGTVLWLFALKYWPLSVAYPVMSINIILVMLYSRAFMGDVISTKQWFGVFNIVLGICLISL